MTSPAQLKYLDAMGIPVWVSRDLVLAVDDAQAALESQSVSDSPQAQQPQRLQQVSQTQQTSQTVVGANSAESILQSLNEATENKNHGATTTSNRQPYSAPTSAVQQSVEQPYSQSQQNRVVDDSTNATPMQNEIARTASHIVYACGSSEADWLIIGESPELNDDRFNQPYSGDSGVLLENMLRAVGVENPRQDACMVNIIKASMQAIVPESVGELNQILNQKIKDIKPKIVLLVGQLSAQNVLQSKEPLARLRAKEQKHPETGTDIVVTYYPTHLLSKPSDKRKAWDDLKLAMRLIDKNSDEPSNE